MTLSSSLLVGLSVLATGVQSRDHLHLATDGLLQIAPSFTGDGINLYPAHRPGHDTSDLQHVVPKLEHDLYYAQEGHRDAMHGAKHGSFKANFTLPTVVLDHTSHLVSIQCGQGIMEACFSLEAFEHAKKHWNSTSINIVTYHVGCGDEYNGQRSYFRAHNIHFDAKSSCVSMKTNVVEQEDAVTSGEISWGTYKHPNKRAPVKGHIKLTDQDNQAVGKRETQAPSDDGDDGNDGAPIGTDEPETPIPTDDEDDGPAEDPGEPEDLTSDYDALTNFFGDYDIDKSNFNQPAPGEENDFIGMDGEVDKEDAQETPASDKKARRRPASSRQRRRFPKQDISARRNRIENRNFFDFVEGVYNGIKHVVQEVTKFVEKAVDTVATVAKAVVNVAVIAAKVIAVPFGVPFDEAYHSDFKFTHAIKGDATNRPPAIFDNTDGFNLASSGGVYSVQCVKCGTHGDFTVEGRLAFTTDGLTHGQVSLVNHDTFNIDAVFGIILEQQYDHSVKGIEKQIVALPLSPLAIPGIVILGPELSISGALDLVLNGKAELLLGGSLSIGSGTAVLSLVDRNENKLDGFQTTFTPVAQFTGTLTASVELGLPIALEVGLDILNGKFKKTVALVNKPSVYASATVTTRQDAACSGGIELRMGVKNRFYIQALDKWDYDIRTDTLYEKGLACITENGFDTNSVEEDVSVFNAVTDAVGTDIVEKIPPVSDISSSLTKSQGKAGFRIIMDADRSSILVAGKDGYIYLVETSEQYDLSSPWGTTDVKSSVVSLDAFGRIMTSIDDKGGMVSDVRLYSPKKVPKNVKPAALVNLKTEHNQDENALALVHHRKNAELIRYTTFCQTGQGLRMFSSDVIVSMRDGQQYIMGPPDKAKDFIEGVDRFASTKNPKCLTIHLVVSSG